MKKSRLITVITGIITIFYVSCDKQTSCNHNLSPIELHDISFYDSTTNVTLSFSLPDTSLFNTEDQLCFANIVTGKQANDISALFESVKAHQRNMNIKCKMIYIDPQVATAQIDVTNWIESGDTLQTTSYISYLRLSKSKLSLQQIAQTPAEIDSLTEWINQKANQSTKISPDVDITILYDSVVFHYDRHVNQRLWVSLPLHKLKKEFKNLKTIYNE